MRGAERAQAPSARRASSGGIAVEQGLRPGINPGLKQLKELRLKYATQLLWKHAWASVGDAWSAATDNSIGG